MRNILPLTGTPLAIDVGLDNAIYVDQIENPVEVLRLIPGAAPTQRWPVTSYVHGDWLLPLPDGRVLMSARVGGRTRLSVTGPAQDPIPFIDTPEETRHPFCLVGKETVAFLIGKSPSAALAIASSSNGNIIRRFDDFKADTIGALAGSPDGNSIYYTSLGTVWKMPAEGGPSERVCAGDGVAVDTEGKYLVVSRIHPDGNRLVRISLTGGEEELLLVAADLKMDWHLAPGAIARDGRIAVKVIPADSWFWQVRIRDPNTGKLEEALQGIPADLQCPSWDADGRLVVAASYIQSCLWRFRPETR